MGINELIAITKNICGKKAESAKEEEEIKMSIQYLW